MAVPENYKKLGTVGTAYKGDYEPNTQYKYLNEVYYNGSTYIALKDNPTGAPNNDGINWKYSARGASEGDTKDNTISFTSNDTIDEDATSWTVVPKLISGIKHSTLVQYISQMFKNVRYLYKMLGTTDISELGDGTVTGVLYSLNSNLPIFVAINERHMFTSSTDIKYTGISIEIPPQSYFCISFLFQQNDGAPAYVGVMTDVNNLLSTVAESRQSNFFATCSYSGYSNTGVTLYTWAKYNNVSTNYILISGFYITKP